MVFLIAFVFFGLFLVFCFYLFFFNLFLLSFGVTWSIKEKYVRIFVGSLPMIDCWLRQMSNRIGGVMVIVLVSSAIDSGFEPWSGQTKNYEIGMCCFAKQ